MGYPLSVVDYYCLTSVFLHQRDLFGAIEIIQDMAKQGLSFSEQRPPSQAVSTDIRAVEKEQDYLYRSIRGLLVHAITSADAVDNKVRSCDELYYTLVDSAANKDNAPIPRVVLDAFITVGKRTGRTERSFAMFQEYKSIFQLKPSVTSYNSLMASCMGSKDALKAVLAVFEDMETTGETDPTCLPNDESFSILIETMVMANDFQVLPQVLELMAMKEIVPHRRALRRLAVAFAKEGNSKGVAEVVNMLRQFYGERTGFPKFLKKRLDCINAALVKKDAAVEAETAKADSN